MNCFFCWAGHSDPLAQRFGCVLRHVVDHVNPGPNTNISWVLKSCCSLAHSLFTWFFTSLLKKGWKSFRLLCFGAFLGQPRIANKGRPKNIIILKALGVTHKGDCFHALFTGMAQLPKQIKGEGFKGKTAFRFLYAMPT